MQASRQLFRVAATRARPTSTRLQAVRCLATDAKAPIHILAISGSLRNASCNTGLLRACAKKLPPNVTMEIYVPIDLPLINQDLETGTLPPNVAAWQEKVKKADAFLFGCPEYNFSVSAPLKNAIDWASRGQHGFNDKPAAIVGAGGGAGSLRAQMHLRDIANFLNLHFFNTPFITARIFDKPSPFDLATGDVVDEKLQQQAQAMVQALVDWTYRLKK